MFSLRGNETDVDNAEELKDGAELIVNQGEEYYISCEAIGSNPAAKMDITFGGKNINDEFNVKINEYTEDSIIAPASALQLVLNDVIMTSKQVFPVQPEMSRQELICSADVQEYEKKSITVKPILKGKSSIFCSSATYSFPQITTSCF